MNKESFIYVVVFTFLVAFVFVFIIALVDDATALRVAQNQALTKANAYLNVVNQSEDQSEKAIEKFTALFGRVEDESIVRASIGGEEILVKQFTGQGLWGTVTGVIAVDARVERILGLDIISHSETPGLGGRIEEDWFKEQFRNELLNANGIAVRKGEGGADSDSENSIVDGVTGASLTSTAMEVIVNNEIAKLREAGE